MSEFGVELDRIISKKREERSVRDQLRALTDEIAQRKAKDILEARRRLHGSVVVQVVQDIRTAHPRLKESDMQPVTRWRNNMWFLLSHVGPVFLNTELLTSTSYAAENSSGTGGGSYQYKGRVERCQVVSVYLDNPTGRIVPVTSLERPGWGNQPLEIRKFLSPNEATPLEPTPETIVPIDLIDHTVTEATNQPIVKAYRDSIRSLISMIS